MVTLVVRRYFSDVFSEHESVSEAASCAVEEYNDGLSWPVSISLDGIIVWECGCNPFENAIKGLKEMALDSGWCMNG